MPPFLASGVLSTIGASHLISTFGAAGVIAIIFAETGIFLGFFLPGDSLLVLAGAYAATTGTGHPHLDLAVLLPGVAAAAVAGGFLGYAIGRGSGESLFGRPDSRFFRAEHVARTREVLERYGEVKAVLLARLIPIVRTFINPVVGIVEMPVRSFAVANVVGGVVWSVAVTLIGYGLGKTVPIDTYLVPITIVVIILSLIPVVRETRRHRARLRAQAAAQASEPTSSPRL